MQLKVNRLDSVVLMHNIWICEDNDAHADKTFEELMKQLAKGGLMNMELLQDALYCCNMNYENEEVGFNHPFQKDFKKFVNDLIGFDYEFDYTYNLISQRKD